MFVGLRCPAICCSWMHFRSNWALHTNACKKASSKCLITHNNCMNSITNTNKLSRYSKLTMFDAFRWMREWQWMPNQSGLLQFQVPGSMHWCLRTRRSMSSKKSWSNIFFKSRNLRSAGWSYLGGWPKKLLASIKQGWSKHNVRSC